MNEQVLVLYLQCNARWSGEGTTRSRSKQCPFITQIHCVSLSDLMTLFQVVKPIIMLVATICADKIGKLQYHDDYKDLLAAPNVRKFNFALHPTGGASSRHIHMNAKTAKFDNFTVP